MPRLQITPLSPLVQGTEYDNAKSPSAQSEFSTFYELKLLTGCHWALSTAYRTQMATYRAACLQGNDIHMNEWLPG